jgi:hypothetical protein
MTDREFGMSPMREAAIGLHEMYVELKRAGFSRNEAMELIARVIADGINGASKGDE